MLSYNPRSIISSGSSSISSSRIGTGLSKLNLQPSAPTLHTRGSNTGCKQSSTQSRPTQLGIGWQHEGSHSDEHSTATRGHRNRDNHRDWSPIRGIPQSLQDYGKTVALATAVVVSTATALAAPAHASNLANSAASLAGQTNAWYSSLVSTGFYQAFSLVFLSEIGDKTFFVAGLLAAQTSRFISFVGSMGALATMTVISVLIGQIFHKVPAGLADGIPLDDIAAVIAFAFFGIKTLMEAFANTEESAMNEELEEAKEEVDKTSSSLADKTALGTIASIFALVFAAEFGDRSFLSTIALSAAQNPVSVAGGAIAAHAAATGVAVSGGAVLAKYISERALGIISGTLFLVFAVTTAFGIF